MARLLGSETVRWNCPPPALRLERREVHVWRVLLDQPYIASSRLGNILSADERERAARYIFLKDRERFIVARGLLRILLGYYTSRDPCSLVFRYGSKGKPELAQESDAQRLCFNVAHSEGVGIYGVTYERDIGVDVERVRSDLEGDVIAKYVLTPREIADLASTPTGSRSLAHTLCWTRKEAYLKARGAGLSIPLTHFKVSFVPGQPAALLSTPESPDRPTCWSLHHLDPWPGYVGALAVKASKPKIRLWELPPEMPAAALTSHSGVLTEATR